ncbi:MAG TPA: hypothetical protein VJM31_18875 [Vicinamibacterales bacterium]|nr:hypothetical protein [Vicinamibacterales bacterium]
MAAQDQDEEAAAAGRATLASFLKHEITRLARKVLRAEIEPLRKAVTHHRGQSAEFKRRIASLEKEIAELRRAEKRRSVAEPVKDDEGPKRWMPKGLASHRAKLGLSADNYARLVGVSGLSIYKWEQGKNTPRRAQQIALAKVRTLGKREAVRRLAELDAQAPSPAPRKKPGRKPKTRAA